MNNPLAPRILTLQGVRTDPALGNLARALAEHTRIRTHRSTLVVDLDPDCRPTQHLTEFNQTAVGMPGVEHLLSALAAGQSVARNFVVHASGKVPTVSLIPGTFSLDRQLSSLRSHWASLSQRETVSTALRRLILSLAEEALVIVVSPSLNGPWAELATGLADDLLMVLTADRWLPVDLQRMNAWVSPLRTTQIAIRSATWVPVPQLSLNLNISQVLLNQVGANFVFDMMANQHPMTRLQTIADEPSQPEVEQLSAQVAALYDPAIGFIG